MTRARWSPGSPRGCCPRWPACGSCRRCVAGGCPPGSGCGVAVTPGRVPAHQRPRRRSVGRRRSAAFADGREESLRGRRGRPAQRPGRAPGRRRRPGPASLGDADRLRVGQLVVRDRQPARVRRLGDRRGGPGRPGPILRRQLRRRRPPGRKRHPDRRGAAPGQLRRRPGRRPGRVVGINTAWWPVVGLGLAVPIMPRPGRSSRRSCARAGCGAPTSGSRAGLVGPPHARRLSATASCIEVVEVVGDSPAARAGIEPRTHPRGDRNAHRSGRGSSG